MLVYRSSVLLTSRSGEDKVGGERGVLTHRERGEMARKTHFMSLCYYSGEFTLIQCFVIVFWQAPYVLSVAVLIKHWSPACFLIFGEYEFSAWDNLNYKIAARVSSKCLLHKSLWPTYIYTNIWAGQPCDRIGFFIHLSHVPWPLLRQTAESMTAGCPWVLWPWHMALVSGRPSVLAASVKMRPAENKNKSKHNK